MRLRHYTPLPDECIDLVKTFKEWLDKYKIPPQLLILEWLVNTNEGIELPPEGINNILGIRHKEDITGRGILLHDFYYTQFLRWYKSVEAFCLETKGCMRTHNINVEALFDKKITFKEFMETNCNNPEKYEMFLKYDFSTFGE